MDANCLRTFWTVCSTASWTSCSVTLMVVSRSACCTISSSSAIWARIWCRAASRPALRHGRELPAHVLDRLLHGFLDFLLPHLDGGVARRLLHHPLLRRHLGGVLVPRGVASGRVIRDLRALGLRQRELLLASQVE